MHPFACSGHKNGALGMSAGDRIVYLKDGRHGVVDEFLYDGECFLTLDDGTYVTCKWRHIQPEILS